MPWTVSNDSVSCLVCVGNCVCLVNQAGSDSTVTRFDSFSRKFSVTGLLVM